jgi:hypothetical protein
MVELGEESEARNLTRPLIHPPGTPSPSVVPRSVGRDHG